MDYITTRQVFFSNENEQDRTSIRVSPRFHSAECSQRLMFRPRSTVRTYEPTTWTWSLEPGSKVLRQRATSTCILSSLSIMHATPATQASPTAFRFFGTVTNFNSSSFGVVLYYKT